MNLITFYIVGVIISFILGCRLYYKEKAEDKQIGMIAILAIISWIAVILIIWKLRDKL